MRHAVDRHAAFVAHAHTAQRPTIGATHRATEGTNATADQCGSDADARMHAQRTAVNDDRHRIAIRHCVSRIAHEATAGARAKRIGE